MRYSSILPLKVIIANASSLTETQKKELVEQGNYLDDDCADSISFLNPWWGELTAIHWLLHQELHGVIGNAHYRRFWPDQYLSLVQEDVLYLSPPYLFPFSMAQQFSGGHGFPGIEMTMEAASRGGFPFSEAEMLSVWSSNRFQGGPMAIGSCHLYRRLMNILFDCLWPIWEIYEDDIKALDGYDRRAIAFLSERLLSGIILMKDKFLPEVVLQSIPLHFIAP